MITRRAAVGAGLAFTVVSTLTGFGAYDLTRRRGQEELAVDALLVDENMEMPPHMAAFINARGRWLPVVGVRLDAATQAALKRVLDKSQTIAGISSGATLFCLERMGWDHGFRLTGRSDYCTRDLSGDACRQDLASFLGGAYPSAASPSSLVRAYRPSRADGMLHAWIMQKSGRPQFRQNQQEI